MNFVEIVLKIFRQRRAATADWTEVSAPLAAAVGNGALDCQRPHAASDGRAVLAPGLLGWRGPLI